MLAELNVSIPEAASLEGERSNPLTRSVALVLFGALVVLSIGGFVATRNSGRADERVLLHERSGEVAAILSSSVNGIASGLELLGEAYAGRGESGPAFVASARSLLKGSVTGIGVAEDTGTLAVVRAFEGTGHRVDDVLDGTRSDLVLRARAANGMVSALIPSTSAESIFVVALGRDDGLVVFQESTISPSQPADSTDDSPFRNLNVALYRSADEDPANRVVVTSGDPIRSDVVDRRLIPVGSEQWSLVTSAKRSLAGRQANALPWLILGGGLVAATLASAVVAVFARRRRYAMDLVEQRTVELRQTLTQLESARHLADVANQSKSEFVSRMSHELRTPLNAVLGFAQLLEIGTLDGPQREAVEHILKGGTHLLNLINEILDIARIESGDIAMSPEAVLVSEVVSETMHLMQPVAAQRSIHFATDADQICSQYVFADRQRLKQILLNVVSNAIKYNSVGGTVAVTCEQVESTLLRIKVADTGPGIRQDQLGLLFTPFERLGAERSNVEGTGIGLALSRRLAEAMGGSLDVDTTYGQGSTFWVELPLVEGPVERHVRLNGSYESNAATSIPAEPSVARHRILYIEDNLANLKLVETIFHDRPDIELIPASQGRLGVELALQHRPALVLLDLHLPDIGGDIVLQQLRDNPVTSKIPVIIVSADATVGQVQRLKSAGATAYLTKPFNVKELLHIVDDILPIATGH
jgi:signal transduction histidine kinase